MVPRRNHRPPTGVSSDVTDRWRAAAVDQQDFLTATLPHLDAVYRVAVHVSRQPADAEDLVQETYLRAFRGFTGHHGRDTRAWLITICLNTARSQFRRTRRRPDERLVADIPEAGSTVAPDAGEQALARLDNEALASALRRLPDEQRIAITLMDLAGLTAAETATALGCPRGTVLARVRRGRQRLARMLLAEGVRDESA